MKAFYVRYLLRTVNYSLLLCQNNDQFDRFLSSLENLINEITFSNPLFLEVLMLDHQLGRLKARFIYWTMSTYSRTNTFSLRISLMYRHYIYKSAEFGYRLWLSSITSRYLSSPNVILKLNLNIKFPQPF